MTKDINLAGKIKKNRLPPQKLSLIRRGALVVGILTVIAAILTFFISIQFSSGNVRSEQIRIEEQLAPYQKKISQTRLLKDRINQLKKVEDERGADLKKIDSVVSKKSADVVINSIILDEGKIEMSFSSTSLFSLKDFLDSLAELKGSAQFQSIKASELEYISGQGYSLTLSIM